MTLRDREEQEDREEVCAAGVLKFRQVEALEGGLGQCSWGLVGALSVFAGGAKGKPRRDMKPECDLMCIS